MKAGIMQPRYLLGYVGRTSAEARAKPPATDVAADAKAFRTLAARCALAGAVLTVETGIDSRLRYVIELRGSVRLFEDIGQIEILVDLIGGAK